MSGQLPPRPNLPSVLDSKNSSQGELQNSSPSQGIKLPPISFLSNLPNLSSASTSQPPTPSNPNGGSSLSLGVSRLLNEKTDSPLFLNDNKNNEDINTTRINNNHIQSNVHSILNHQPTQDHQNNNHVTAANRNEPSFLTSNHNNNHTHQTHHHHRRDNSNGDNKQLPLNSLISPTDDQPTHSGVFTSPVRHSNNNNTTTTHQSLVKLKEDITKPDVEEESDDEIIKYYQNKYGIDEFTNEEKHDILQHERRARIEKAKNPNYKTYLCYSIIKRLNAIPPTVIPTETTKTQEKPLEKPIESPPVVVEEKIVKRDKFIKRKIEINNEETLKIASKFPRKYLGSILYTPFPTKSTYSQLSIYEKDNEDSNPNEKVPLLPELNEFINSIITVRIPSYQISDLANNENFLNRNIWGTDIYTDDSDILLILKHNGFLQIEENDNNEKIVKSTPGNIDNKQSITQKVSNFRQFMNIIDGDLHVDLIILPKLVKYEGIYRNGINSRSWESEHDGVSIAIHSVKYGEKLSSVEDVNSAEFKKRKLNEVLNLNKFDDTVGFKLDLEAYKRTKLELELSKKKVEEKV